MSKHDPKTASKAIAVIRNSMAVIDELRESGYSLKAIYYRFSGEGLIYCSEQYFRNAYYSVRKDMPPQSPRLAKPSTVAGVAIEPVIEPVMKIASEAPERDETPEAKFNRQQAIAKAMFKNQREKE